LLNVKRQKQLLIVGLGNPGKEYAMTRHNIGFLVVDLFVSQYGWPFKRERHLHALCAKGQLEEIMVSVLKPETYMNLSGNAVKKFLEAHRTSPSEMVAVVDDADLPFGDLRLKAFGSSGGHNGLKSIEESLGTNRFARLRVGIGRSEEKALIDFVLEPFAEKELQLLPETLQRACEALALLLEHRISKVMSEVNAKK